MKEISLSDTAKNLIEKATEGWRNQIIALAKQNAINDNRSIVSEKDVKVALIGFCTAEAIMTITTGGNHHL